jgi:hypothetical protein
MQCISFTSVVYDSVQRWLNCVVLLICASSVALRATSSTLHCYRMYADLSTVQISGCSSFAYVTTLLAVALTRMTRNIAHARTHYRILLQVFGKQGST